MTEHLSVDDRGMNAAATASSEIAATLATTSSVSPSAGSQPSHAGASAMEAALASVRDRQAIRVSNHAKYLKIGSGVYRDTDHDAADAVTRTV